MSTIELGKSQFWTIEAFYFEYEGGCFYETERCEDLDTFWWDGVSDKLGEYVEQQCSNNLSEDDHVIVAVTPRRYAVIVDGFPEDYGDDCLGRVDFIWNGEKLQTEEEYANALQFA